MEKKKHTFLERLFILNKAGCSLVKVDTFDEERLQLEIKAEVEKHEGYTFGVWDSVRGLSGNATYADGLAAIQHIAGNKEPNQIIVFKDFHLQFDKVLTRANLIRTIKYAANILKSVGTTLVFVNGIGEFPKELGKLVIEVDYTLPDAESIKNRLSFVKDSYNKDVDAANRVSYTEAFANSVVDAAKGLTFHEVETALAIAFIAAKGFNDVFVEEVFAQKIQALKKNSLIEYIPVEEGFESVGGLNELKEWFSQRNQMFSQRARDFGLNPPKGVLLSGVPGVGKTTIARAIAKEFNIPLFKVDIGALFDKHVGASEKNFRDVIKIIDSLGRCVILIDEIEKSVSVNATSGAGDSGTSSRTFATLMTWMNDRTSDAFIVATSNDHTILPDALIRKGRFDECFWLDLPDQEELEQIYNVILKSKKRKFKPDQLSKLAEKSKGFTGAEVYSVVTDALIAALIDNSEDVTFAHLVDQIDNLKPQSKAYSDAFTRIRNHAKHNLRFASKDENQKVIEEFRKLTIT